MFHKEIQKAILKSQHCNRNFDLNQTIPKEDLDLLITAVSKPPSKQNIAFYKVHFILDRSIIEQIHSLTVGFGTDPKNYQTNSQTLANLLVVFEDMDVSDNQSRNEQTKAKNEGASTYIDKHILQKDRDQAVGIAAGYLNLTASLLGYVTGCCACFDAKSIKNLLHLSKDPLLLMGIGFKDSKRNRREHHLDPNFIFPSFRKQAISVNVIDNQSSKVS